MATRTAGQEPWTLAGVTKKTWQRKQRESRMTPAELDAYRDRTRATARAATACYKAKLRSSRPSRRATNAIPLSGVNVYDRFHGKGASRKGQRRPLRVMSTPARVARRSLALRAALERFSKSSSTR